MKRIEARYKPLGDAITTLKNDEMVKLLEDRARRIFNYMDDFAMATAGLKDLAIAGGGSADPLIREGLDNLPAVALSDGLELAGLVLDGLAVSADAAVQCDTFWHCSLLRLCRDPAYLKHRGRLTRNQMVLIH